MECNKYVTCSWLEGSSSEPGVDDEDESNSSDEGDQEEVDDGKMMRIQELRTQIEGTVIYCVCAVLHPKV